MTNTKKPILLTLFSLSMLSPLTIAQEQAGDVIMSIPSGVVPAIKFFDRDGNLNRSVESQGGSPWTASALRNDGGVVVHNTNFMKSVITYDAANQLVSSFNYTPLYISTDLDVFSDNTIAICSRLEGILQFDEMGNPMSTITIQGMNSANGLQIQDDDTIWIADLLNFNSNTDGRIWHIDRAGNVLHMFNTTFDPSDVAVAPDGSVWTSSTEGLLTRFDTQGNILNQFEAEIIGSDHRLESLAVDDDGIIWASGFHDVMIRGYSNTGTVLYEFSTGYEPNSMFMTAVPGTTLTTPICSGAGTVCPCGNIGDVEGGCQNSTGTGASLWVGGTTSVTGDALLVSASKMPGGRPAIAFSGSTRVFNGQNLGAPFGDGLQCAGGHIQRLGVKTTSTTGVADWGPGLGSYGGWDAGDTRIIQVWYSDPFGPCSSGFNLTNAVEVVFIP